MRVYLLNKFSGERGVSSLHYHMFHGLAVGEPLTDLLAPYHTRKHFTHPLQVIRNGWRVPHVFRPMINLVVSRKVRDALEGRGRFVFRPVEFVKLVHYPYWAHDDWFYTSGEHRKWPGGPESLLRSLPDVPEYHQAAGRFFEITLPRPDYLAPTYSDTRAVPVKIPWVAYSDTRELLLSEDMLADYQILHDGFSILAEPAFELLTPFIHWDYFDYIELTI